MTAVHSDIIHGDHLIPVAPVVSVDAWQLRDPLAVAAAKGPMAPSPAVGSGTAPFMSVQPKPATSFNRPLIIAVGFAMTRLAVTGLWLLFRTMWRHDTAWMRRPRRRPGVRTGERK